MDFIEIILYDTIYHATPILLCVLGGLFAYKANVLNIALEGMMLSGAFFILLFYYLSNHILYSVLLTFGIVIVLAIIFCMLGIYLQGNIIVVGLGINLLSVAMTTFILKKLGLANISLQHISVAEFKIAIPFIAEIPILKSFSNHPFITYISILLIPIVHILLYQTKFGIYTRVVGENEEAAISLGIPYRFYRYISIIIGALFCTLAGINLSFERMAMYTHNMTAGRGFIAIAAIYCGQGDPISCAIYALLFGITRALSINLGIYTGAWAGLFDVVPYIIMIMVLMTVSYFKHRNHTNRVYKLGQE